MPIPYRPAGLVLPGDIQRMGAQQASQAASDSEARRLAANQDQPVSPMDMPAPQPQEQAKPSTPGSGGDITKGRMSQLSGQYRHATSPDGLFYTSPRTGKVYRVNQPPVEGGVAQWDPEITLEDTGRRVEPFSWRGIGDTTSRQESEPRRTIETKPEAKESTPAERESASQAFEKRRLESAVKDIERTTKLQRGEPVEEESEKVQLTAGEAREKALEAVERMSPEERARAETSHTQEVVMSPEARERYIDQERKRMGVAASKAAEYAIEKRKWEAEIKEKFPDIYKIYSLEGMEAAMKEVDRQRAEYEASKPKPPAFRRDTELERLTQETIRVGRFAAESQIPYIGTAREWDNLTTKQKAMYLAIDTAAAALILVPGVGQAATGARSYAGASKAVRFAAAKDALLKELFSQVKAPFEMVAHPIKATKAAGREARNLFEDVFIWRKIPESAATTTADFVKFKVRKGTSFAEAMRMRDEAVELARQGKDVRVVIGDVEVSLRASPLMKEAGGLAHVSPDLSALEQGTKVKAAPGMPISEQGWFLSPEPVTKLTQGSASGKGIIPLPLETTGAMEKVAKYKPTDLVRLDKKAIRPINLADAKSVPPKLAQPLKDYILKNDIAVWGSFDEWVKVKGAMKPNDLDLVVRDSQKAQAIQDVIAIAEKNGFKARAVDKGVDILDDNGEWQRLLEFRKETGHAALLPAGYLQKASNRIEGIRFGNLGTQYLLQSFGSIAGDAKATVRAQKLAKAAEDVKQLLLSTGAEPRKPGIFIVTGDAAIPTDKLFYDWVEFEAKYPVGANIPKPAQKLYTRLGPMSERAEIWLEKPLSKGAIARLKARGLLEALEAPFKPAMRISGLTKGETEELAYLLRQGGNRIAARNLLRAEGLARVRAARIAPLPLSRFGRLSARELGETRKRIAALPARPPTSRLAREERDAIRKREERLISEGRGTGQGREGASRVEPPRTEITRLEPPRTDLPRTEPPRTEPPRSEPPRTTPPRVEPPRAQPPRSEPPRTEPPRTEPPRIEPPRLEPPRIEPPRIKPPSLGGKTDSDDWTEKEIKSAIKWKDGFVIHALKYPYRRGVDEKSFHIDRLPPGLDMNDVLDLKGAGSQEKSLKVEGRPPKTTTVDVGNQNLIIRQAPGGKVKISYEYDKKGTSSGLTIKKRPYRPPAPRMSRPSMAGRLSGIGIISKRQGRIHRAIVGGSVVLSRRPIRGLR